MSCAATGSGAVSALVARAALSSVVAHAPSARVTIATTAVEIARGPYCDFHPAKDTKFDYPAAGASSSSAVPEIAPSPSAALLVLDEMQRIASDRRLAWNSEAVARTGQSCATRRKQQSPQRRPCSDTGHASPSTRHSRARGCRTALAGQYDPDPCLMFLTQPSTSSTRSTS